jgi:spermidine synthase
VGGVMTFAWSSDNKALRQVDINTIRERYKAANIKTRYYNPDVHVASFALPQYVLEAVGKSDNS